MTDPKLLPMPPKQVLDLHIPSGVRLYGHSNESMQDYARDNVSHATAPLQAEIERLRAEREVIVAEAVKYAEKSGRLEAKAYLLAEALRDIESRTWNGVRPIQIAARAALRDHEQERKDG